MKPQPENTKWFLLELLNYGTPSPPPGLDVMKLESGEIMITEGVEQMITE